MIRKIMLLLLLLSLGSLTLYAQTVPVMGDVNKDNQVTIVDALIVAQYYVGLNPTVFTADAADVNGTETIDIVDALLIAQYFVGLIKEFPAAAGVEIVKSTAQRNPAPQPANGELDAVVNGNNQFAFDYYRKISADEENIFFSPVSISFAFAMCYAGAAGNTAVEIANTMHFTLPGEKLHNAFNALDLALTTPSANPSPKDGEDLKLSIANSSWGQKNYTFLSPFLDILAVHYGAGMNLVNFKTDPENSRILINNWVSQKTEERIKDLLPQGSIDPLTRLVLTNAIYFKANWLDPFNTTDTTNGLFTQLNGSTVTVPLMRQITTTSYTAAAGQYQAIRLPYQGTKKNAMIIVLPEAGQFNAFESSFTWEKYSAILQNFSRYQVTLTMPKFSYEWSASLKSPLRSLGMTDAFKEIGADFSGINGLRDLYISDVFHKAFVAVDEKGTEASAATAIVIATTSMPPTAAMTINRPFLFIIYNMDTKAILFLGRVLKP